MGVGSGIRDPRSGIRDPVSGKNLFRIPDPGPGVKKAPDPGSRIRIRKHCFWVRKEVPGRAVRVPVGDHPRPHLRPHLRHLRPARQHAHRCQGTIPGHLSSDCCGSVTFWYGSVPVTHGDSWIRIHIWIRILIFSSLSVKTPTNFFYSRFFLITFLKLHLHYLLKIKSHEEVTKL
jgi:hypothetical protein